MTRPKLYPPKARRATRNHPGAPHTITATHTTSSVNGDQVTIGEYVTAHGASIPVNTLGYESSKAIADYAKQANLPIRKVTVQRTDGSLDIWMP